MTEKRNHQKLIDSNQDDNVFQHGKVPPQSVDIEDAVLGEMMIDKDALIEGLSLLFSDAFYKESNRVIFNAIQTLFNESHPVDIISVTDKLKKQGALDLCGGAYYITMLTNRVTGGTNIDYHSHIILQKYLARKGIIDSLNFERTLYEDTTDVFDAYADMSLKLIEGYSILNKKQLTLLGDITRDAVKKIIFLKQNPSHLNGMPSGLVTLDEVTQGFSNSDFVIIASRPSMGKTALLDSMVYNIGVLNRKPCGIFSLEMSNEQLSQRLISIHTAIDHSKIRSGSTLADHEAERINQVCADFDAPVIIDDTASLNIIELRAKAIEMKRKFGIEIIFIDYLQLMKGSGKANNREQEVAQISRGLKILAKELEIPVIALSQLSRECEKRIDKKPMLSDLRESGSIEQDADMVIFIYRPSYYKIVKTEDGSAIPEDEAWLIVAKNRHGNTEDVRVQFIRERMLFKDYSDFAEKHYEQYNDSEIQF